MNIGELLAERARDQADDVGLVEAATGKVLSFQELNGHADALAFYLQDKGVRAGERVILMVRPSADFICLTFALFKLGAVVILIDPGMGYKNLLRCIAGVQPQVFIGIPEAHLFRHLFRSPFRSVRSSFCCGGSLGLLGADLCKEAGISSQPFPAYPARADELAAIIFTTGSTGPPKGVRYEHGVFNAQLQLIRDYYQIGPGQIDQPGFPLFALFSTALGARAVIPDMDPTRPAKVDPQKFIRSLREQQVTFSFGSPAIWNVVSRYCQEQGIILESLQQVLMAGAPIHGDLVARMQNILPTGARIHTPYGATESLPIVSIEGKEIVESTWPLSRQGYGICVGRPLPGIEIRVIALSDFPVPLWNDTLWLPDGEIGEIVVRGDVVTRAYENNIEENRLAKIKDNTSFWHRMGDLGYLDTQGRLWFCGRRAHRVRVKDGTLNTIPCEAIINEHPDVARSALVGIPDPHHPGWQLPVIIVEMVKTRKINRDTLLAEVRKLAAASPLTDSIQFFLTHPDFPVDIRHNAKIFREKLSCWAQKKIQGRA
ncbi:MAG: fatty acid CoA ligase family protein [Pseudomonadota bacterium]